MTATDPNNILGALSAVSVRNRFEAYPREYLANTDSFRAVVGLKGKFSDQWSWETAYNYNDAKQNFANANLIRSAARAAAVTAGKINLFSRTQPAGALDGVLGSATGKFVSNLYSLDFKAVGENLYQLPGGGISVALGGERRQEKLTADSDKDSQSATFAYDSGTTIDPFSQKRDITAFFAEARVPLVGKNNRMPGIYAADLSLAARNEHYSDAGSPTVPKFTLGYQPIDDSLLFRATFSRSFAAPTLFELHAPTGIGFTNPVAEFGGNQANQSSTPVTSLSPSRSTNYSMGVVWTPKAIKGFSASVDYFDIKQTAVISNLGATGVVDVVFHEVESKGTASPYAKMMHIGDFTGPTVTAPGQISSNGLDNIYFTIPAASNLGAQKLKGFDIKFSYEIPIPDAGTLRLDSSSTYYHCFDIKVAPGLPYTPTAGLVTGLNGSIPRWRTYNVLSYEQSGYSASIAHTYYPSMRDTTWVYVPDGYTERIPAYSVFDASVSYEIKSSRTWFRGMKLTFGVNNIGNKMPPRSATFDGLSNADIGEFSPIGRLFYVSGSYKF
jgi:iron complex outermembrane recepter protein